jgi:hypothetical protein
MTFSETVHDDDSKDDGEDAEPVGELGVGLPNKMK